VVVSLEKVTNKGKNMKFFIEITLLPDVEIPIYFLWEKVYQQIHLALVEIQDAEGQVSIGASFPQYSADQRQLGSKLRLMALSSAELEKLHIHKWLSRLSDYVHITTVREVPKGIKEYAFFKRIQSKSSNSRLAKRKAKREGTGYDQALSALGDHQEQLSNAPYIQIKSLSTNRRYRLMINCVNTTSCNGKAKFSTYGLSSTSPIPMF
jgi:CRISPR-associated endonuclease Csy4